MSFNVTLNTVVLSEHHNAILSVSMTNMYMDIVIS